MNEYQQKRIIEQEERNVILAKIANNITPELKKLGIVVELKEPSGEYLVSKISLTHQELKYFKATISFSYWNKQKATLYFDDHISVSRPNGTMHNGEKITHSEKYQFTREIRNEVLEEIGLVKYNYSIELNQLRKDFKPTKNIKLILNDLIPNIEKYAKVVELATPSIDERIKEDENFIALKQKLWTKAGYKDRIDGSQSNLELKIEGLGHVKLQRYSGVEVTKVITKEELANLIA